MFSNAAMNIYRNTNLSYSILSRELYVWKETLWIRLVSRQVINNCCLEKSKWTWRQYWSVYIDIQWKQYCLGMERVRFSERHMTRFRPMTCTHLQIWYNNMYRACQKIIPYENFCISGIIVDFFTKFTLLSGEDLGHISCKFYYSNLCGSTDTPV